MAPVFPYSVELTHPYSILGLGLTIIGFALLLTGIVLGVYHASQRGWYLDQLKKAHEVEEMTLRSIPVHESTKRTKK